MPRGLLRVSPAVGVWRCRKGASASTPASLAWSAARGRRPGTGERARRGRRAGRAGQAGQGALGGVESPAGRSGSAAPPRAGLPAGRHRAGQGDQGGEPRAPRGSPPGRRAGLAWRGGAALGAGGAPRRAGEQPPRAGPLGPSPARSQLRCPAPAATRPSDWREALARGEEALLWAEGSRLAEQPRGSWPRRSRPATPGQALRTCEAWAARRPCRQRRGQGRVRPLRRGTPAPGQRQPAVRAQPARGSCSPAALPRPGGSAGGHLRPPSWAGGRAGAVVLTRVGKHPVPFKAGAFGVGSPGQGRARGKPRNPPPRYPPPPAAFARNPLPF